MRASLPLCRCPPKCFRGTQHWSRATVHAVRQLAHWNRLIHWKSRRAHGGTALDKGLGMIATVHTGSLSGVDAPAVVVEVGQACGLPGFDIVGMPEAALRESRVHVVAAIGNSGFSCRTGVSS